MARSGGILPYTVDFSTVSTVGLESSPVAAALAGLRANEARYFKNKYGHVFTVEPAGDATTTIDWVHRILKEERDIVISSRPLEATAFQVEDIRMAYVFYESGLSINVMYTVDDSREAGGRVQALRRDGSPRGARLAVQVREAEVEASRNHSRFLLHHQERVLTRARLCEVSHLLPAEPVWNRLRGQRSGTTDWPGRSDQADLACAQRAVRARLPGRCECGPWWVWSVVRRLLLPRSEMR